MQAKDNYLIWREKNGFFSAVDLQNYLTTWSVYTGRLLYRLKLYSDHQIEGSENYKTVWQMNDDDYQSCSAMNYLNEKDYALNLIIQKRPIDQQEDFNIFKFKVLKLRVHEDKHSD